MEDLIELLILIEKKYPTKDKKNKNTYIDNEPLTIGMLKELLNELIDK